MLCENVKLVIATCVVLLLVLVVFIGVANSYCVLEIHPAANFVLLFMALLLLAYCEALHYGVVSIEKWDMTQYQEKYPRACKVHKLVDTPNKVKKFLVGRQFFTIFVVFLISQITSFPHIPKDFGGMPEVLVLLLFQIGLPGVALVLTFGQLVSQLYVEEFTLQFLNMYGCEFVVRLSLGAEWLGICHFSWLLFHTVTRLACSSVRKAQREMNQQAPTMNSSDAIMDGDAEANKTPNPEDAGPMSPTALNRGPDFDTGLDDKIPLGPFDLLRYAWSTLATIGSLFIIFYGISIQAYVLPSPPGATYIIFFMFLCLLFYLEGLMIAVVATQYWDRDTFKDHYPRAAMLHELMTRDKDNIQRFIIGRQFCTVLTNFMLGQITTMATFPSDGYNPIGFYIIVKSGLVGVMVVLAFAQLCPELTAAEYPLRFMNLPGAYSVGCLSMIFDAVGTGHCAWAVYFVTRKLCCGSAKGEGELENGEAAAAEKVKPAIVRVNSAEILAASQRDSAKGASASKWGL